MAYIPTQLHTAFVSGNRAISGVETIYGHASLWDDFASVLGVQAKQAAKNRCVGLKWAWNLPTGTTATRADADDMGHGVATVGSTCFRRAGLVVTNEVICGFTTTTMILMMMMMMMMMMMVMMMSSLYVALCAAGMALLCFMCGGHSEMGPLERQHGQQLSSRYRPRRRYSPKGHTSRRRACLLRMLALVSLVDVTHGFQPADKTALKTALEAWCTNELIATTTYGDINTWDVSLVTDMSFLLDIDFSSGSSCADFNSDISAWDVSRVTDME
jgi:surface protein